MGRQACASDFQEGVCSFALADRVCPRKLLHCLVANRKQLSSTCAMQAQTEIIRVVEHDQHDPIREACSIFAWVLILLTLIMCCTCCCKLILKCCCAICGKRSHTQVETVVGENVTKPTAPLDSEDAELEMALMMSAMAAGVPTHGKVVDGIPT